MRAPPAPHAFETRTAHKGARAKISLIIGPQSAAAADRSAREEGIRQTSALSLGEDRNWEEKNRLLLLRPLEGGIYPSRYSLHCASFRGARTWLRSAPAFVLPGFSPFFIASALGECVRQIRMPRARSRVCACVSEGGTRDLVVRDLIFLPFAGSLLGLIETRLRGSLLKCHFVCIWKRLFCELCDMLNYCILFGTV